ncbi:MAG: IS91 family transposase [Lachnospiraceae bacterium]|nr:IS91 family transposase [Lachnospiraceae bacterium]
MGDVNIQDVFEQFLPMIADHHFSDEQFNAIRSIRNCRTAAMGAHVSEGEVCHSAFIHYNSCKNRHCPMCQGMEVDEWIDLRREDVLDAPYFHTVFSIPSQLYALTYTNQKLLYNVMYHAANKTLAELSSDPKHLGARIGYICILHTWGSKLNYHPHLHTIVLGGGLDKNNHWKDTGSSFFLPVKVLSAVFKRHYLDELKLLHEAGKLVYSGQAEHFRNSYEFKELLNSLYAMDWVVYNKKTFKGAHEVFRYLGKYTHRIAISNRRLISIDHENVSFMAKDYKDDARYKPFTMSGKSFLSLFLMHVLPKGFVRIRYYGILSCRCKREKITLCRNILGCTKYLSMLRGKKTDEKLLILYNRDIHKCQKCQGRLVTYNVPGRYMLC